MLVKPPKRKIENGFTIIEVVLVLAIAGLIFLIVFLALPALQASQRDTQRKRNLDSIVALTQSFATNNYRLLPCNEATTSACNLPTALNSWKSFRNNYLVPAQITSPETVNQTCGATTVSICAFALNSGNTTDSLSDSYQSSSSYDPGTILYGLGGACSGSSLNYGGVGAPFSRVAMWVKLERGSYCREI